MKKLATIFVLFFSLKSLSQDSVKAKVTHTAENTLRYKVNGYKFVSFCKCDLKRGDIFWIERKRFDSLLKEARPIRKRDLN